MTPRTGELYIFIGTFYLAYILYVCKKRIFFKLKVFILNILLMKGREKVYV